jgi:hypothetical protein
MKPCIRCFRVLPLTEFYVHPQMRDGHLNACKACVKLGVRLWHRRTAKDRSDYEKQRAGHAGRRAYQLAAQADYRRRNPDKYKARTAVNNAVRDGRLTRRPCAGCGATDNVQAHHENYSRPLDVRWLCFICHREGEHRQTVRRR